MQTEFSANTPHPAAGRDFRRVQDVLDCEDEAATVEEAAIAWRMEDELSPPGNAGRERFRDALLAAISEGWIAVYPPPKLGGNWTVKVLR